MKFTVTGYRRVRHVREVEAKTAEQAADLFRSWTDASPLLVEGDGWCVVIPEEK